LRRQVVEEDDDKYFLDLDMKKLETAREKLSQEEKYHDNE